MTLFISIIFILSSYVLIFHIPASHEYNNQGYHQSTISQVLTPSERFAYVFFGTLPSRIYYSYEKRCYVVRGQAGYYKNDLRRKKGKRYKAVPRWQYYLSKLSPVSLIKSGFEFLSIGKSMLFGGGDGDEEEDLKNGGADPDADDGADGGADDGNDNDKEPGLLSKGMSMLSPLFNLFGGSKDTNNDNNNENKDDSKDKKDENNDKKDEKKDENNDKKDEKKDENNDKKDEKKDDNKDDKKGDDKPEDSTDYMGMAEDILQSDTTKDAVKTGISLFVPGGPAIVSAMDTYSKYQSAEEKLDKVEDKIPKLK